MHRRPRLTLALPLAGALGLAACASPVDVDPGPRAADPLCAQVLVALRSDGFAEIGGRERRPTTSQSTAAWGDPPVVLRCGVEPPGPTTDPCVGIDGVDWVATRPGDVAVFTTYGRTPAVEVAVPGGDGEGPDIGPDVVLAALGPVVAGLPQERQCL